MSDIFSLMDEEVDAGKFDKVSGEKGSALSTLIRESIKIDEEIAQAEQYLKDLKFKKRKVNEEDIPSLMQEMGMDSITVDGNKVALRQFVHARITDEKRDEAFSWLRSIGEGDIIKNDVTVSFNVGQDNMAGAVIDDLRNRGFEPAQKTHVHPQTLKAWVKGRIESGKDIDFDTFGIYVGTEAKIKRN
jgi:hypothetical protein|tara:strand:- start:7434 stop:7997 length:564 start_codon:yes stop_codon:yes gene_type:complete